MTDIVTKFEQGVQNLKSRGLRDSREAVNVAEILRGYGLSLGMPDNEN